MSNVARLATAGRVEAGLIQDHVQTVHVRDAGRKRRRVRLVKGFEVQPSGGEAHAPSKRPEAINSCTASMAR